MQQLSRRVVMALFGTSAIAFAVACSDSTGPVVLRIPGNYELTTVLNTYTYAYSCVPGSNGPVCSDSTVPAGASTLHGTFTVGDATQGPRNAFQFPITNAVLHQADCALASTPCTEETQPWSSASFTVTRDSGTVFGEFLYPMQIYLNGQFAGDRFTGEISWLTYVGCCAINHYDGTFVATRQR